ncbi:MAG: FAD-binding oxidoreductase [Streptosporangiales bacterium]
MAETVPVDRSVELPEIVDATELDAVGDVPARQVARPRSTEEVAALMRMASDKGWAVVPRGTGTKLEWGRPPERVDILLDTGRLVGVVDHAAGDLVVRVRAGTTMSSLAAGLVPKRQRLALTTRLPAQDGPVCGTVGGTIAANPSSPLRYAYGTVRDTLIGVTMVRADGTIAHSGGAVVKNVAGYDLGKLLTGSLGTLGILTEAVFRLHPAPEHVALVTRTAVDGAEAGRLAATVRRSQLVPAAVEVDGQAPGPFTVAVLVEGASGGVPARAEHAAEILGEGAVVTAIASHARMPSWWFAPAADAAGTSLRIAVAPSGVGHVIDQLGALASKHNLVVHCRGSVGIGVLHAGLAGEADPAAVALLVQSLRRTAEEHDGTVVAEHAPADVHEELAYDGTDAFGPVPALDLMRRVKDQFDPARILAPGRFVGGI